MEYRRCGELYLIRIDYAEEILQALGTVCEKEQIALGQVNAIGAADHAVIGVYDLGTQSYHREEINGFMEITNLSGNVTRVDGKPYIHLHATLADQNHAVHGGHVIEMRVGATCEMFITVPEGEVTRKKDEGLGINLWSF